MSRSVTSTNGWLGVRESDPRVGIATTWSVRRLAGFVIGRLPKRSRVIAAAIATDDHPYAPVINEIVLAALMSLDGAKLASGRTGSLKKAEREHIRIARRFLEQQHAPGPCRRVSGPVGRSTVSFVREIGDSSRD